MPGRILAFLKARADNVAVGLLTALFLFFMVQIVSRYVFNRPLGWTTEACLISWLWLVFWGSGLLVPNREQVQFDVLTVRAGPRVRWIAAVLGGLFVVAAFAWALFPSIDFIDFMAIEDTGTLKIPFNVVFSVFVVFAVGVIVRQGWYLIRLLRGTMPEDLEAPGPEKEIREV